MPMHTVSASRTKNAIERYGRCAIRARLSRIHGAETRRWLYALATPAVVDPHTELSAWDYRLLAHDIVHEKFSYRARALDSVRMDAELCTTACAHARCASPRRAIRARSNGRVNSPPVITACRTHRCSAARISRAEFLLHAETTHARCPCDRRIPARHASRLLRALRR